ncbi:unnamed protein product [Periconia digitata]|uniref:Uncharacterized protein n=1 Tax=Periconia digitata TaxID=1303443 RepID=A0A9W4UNG5_9PLEO|nr:unnamed protein product [Periconia digitata]
MTNLDDLPGDVKRLITAELYKSEADPAIRKVSRVWHDLAEPFIYRGLAWAVDLETLKEDAKRLFTKDDLASKFLEYARYIHISDTPYRYPEPGPSDEDCRLSDISDASIQPACFAGLSVLPRNFDLDEPAYPEFDEVIIGNHGRDREAAERVWEPFVSAFARFRYLTDIVFQSSHPIPPGFMASIEKHHPTCRLHMRSFRFQSLNEAVTDLDERALAMSKNLHSLSIKCATRQSTGMADHNGAAALRTMELAPNLKHVRWLGCRPASSFHLYQARGQPLPRWDGFVPAIINSEGQHRQKLQLESLSFLGYDDYLHETKFAIWDKLVDFSHLKSLTFSTHGEAFLNHITTHDVFPNLKSLGLTLTQTEAQQTDPAGWQTAIEHFTESLRPLSSLHLHGTIHPKLLETIASTHGETLRELAIHPYSNGYNTTGPPLRLTPAMLTSLASQSPHLTTLTLTLKRSMGDRTETACYEALSTLPSLKHLTLGLDCQNPRQRDLAPDPTWSDFDKATQTAPGASPKEYNGHFKIAIVNSALDEYLVRDIWDVLNRRRRAPERLQSFTVHTFGGSAFGSSHPGDLMAIVQHISRKYRAVALNDGGVKVTEMLRKKREEMDATQRAHEKVMIDKYGNKGHDRGSYLVFKHLWPHEDDVDWRKVWRSWPLQRDGSST